MLQAEEVPSEESLFTQNFWVTLVAGALIAVVTTILIRWLFKKYLKTYATRWFSERSFVLAERLSLFLSRPCR